MKVRALCILVAVLFNQVFSKLQPIHRWDNSVSHFIEWYLGGSSNLIVINYNFRPQREIQFVITNFKCFNDYQRFKTLSNKTLIVKLNNLENIQDILMENEDTIIILIARSMYSGLFEKIFKSRKKQVILINTHTKSIFAFNVFNNTVEKSTFYNFRKHSNTNNYFGIKVECTLFESLPTSFKINNQFNGIDSSVVEAVSKKLNINLDCHIPKGGDDYGSVKNGNGTGAIGELYTRKIDVIFNNLFLKDYHVNNSVFTDVIMEDPLCVVVPAAKKIPTWMGVIRVFNWLMWVYIVVTFTVSVFVLYMLQRFTTKRYLSVLGATLEVIKIVFNTSEMVHKTSKVTEKLLLSTIIFFGLIFSTIFQSSLVNVLTVPGFYPEIDTLEDLAISEYRVSSSSSSLASTFAGFKSQHMEELNRKFYIANSSMPKSVAYLIRKTKGKYLTFKQKFETSDIKMHLVKECPLSYLLAYLTHKQLFFLRDLNRVILGLVQGGFINKWEADAVRNMSYIIIASTKNTTKTIDVDFSIRPFEYDDLASCFILLYLGLCFSLMMFVFEFIYGCRNRKTILLKKHFTFRIPIALYYKKILSK